MARYNITFSLKDTPSDVMVKSIEAALAGDLSVAEKAGATVERAFCPAENALSGGGSWPPTGSAAKRSTGTDSTSKDTRQ